MLEQQITLARENNAVVSIVDVSSEAKVVVELSTDIKSYSINPSGGTALLDGLYLGTFIANRNIDRFDRTLVICITDGEENQSKFGTWDLVNNTIDMLDKTNKFAISFFGTIETMNQVQRGLKSVRPQDNFIWQNTSQGAAMRNKVMSASAGSYYAGSESHTHSRGFTQNG